jgi:hypothetical protein
MAYRISVPTVSPVRLVYANIADLLDNVREILENEDNVSMTIETVAMTLEEIEALPEFEGY